MEQFRGFPPHNGIKISVSDDSKFYFLMNNMSHAINVNPLSRSVEISRIVQYFPVTSQIRFLCLLNTVYLCGPCVQKVSSHCLTSSRSLWPSSKT